MQDSTLTSQDIRNIIVADDGYGPWPQKLNSEAQAPEALGRIHRRTWQGQSVLRHCESSNSAVNLSRLRSCMQRLNACRLDSSCHSLRGWLLAGARPAKKHG